MDVGTMKVMTIGQTAQRCQMEGIPLGTGALRRLVNTHRLPATYIGKKALICWDDVLDLFKTSSTVDSTY